MLIANVTSTTEVYSYTSHSTFFQAEKAEEATEKSLAKVESQLKENIRRWKEMSDGPCKVGFLC